LVLSSNDSLNLLRQFLQNFENQTKEQEFAFPYNLNVHVSQSKTKEMQVAKIEHLIESISDANELVTLHRVLSNRNWEIHYS
jgi:hypothetical protein